MIRVLIADDHPVVRSGLRAVFEAEEDMAVVGEVARAADALGHARKLDADIVTMDLQFPDGISGVEAIERLTASPDAPAVLVITNYDGDADILAAISGGASGYLLKDAPPSDLARAVRQAVAGQPVLAPSVAAKMMTSLRRPRASLTPRESEVLDCLVRGLSNKEIGAELFLSQPTVKSHLAHLYGKLGVPSRTAAVAKARELGLA